MAHDFSDKVVLVTGASRGFGWASAHAFAAAGGQVVAVARTQGALEELDDAIRAAGGPAAVLVPLDITDDAGLARLGAAVHERFGRVDLWLHTAFLAPPLAPVAHIAEKDLDRCVATGLKAYQRMIRAIDPLLRQAPEPTALIAADDPQSRPFHGLYGAVKAAQAALTEAWRVEAAGKVAVTALRLPAMPTALRGRFYPGEDRDGLARPAEVAGRLLDALATEQPRGILDLGRARVTGPEHRSH
ncbi:MAG: SDR family oxidoreductase [Pseudomonadota bacterium]